MPKHIGLYTTPTDKDQPLSTIVFASNGEQFFPSDPSSTAGGVCPYLDTGGQIMSLNCLSNLLHTKYDPKNKNRNKTKIQKIKINNIIP
jgi:hypothetical protein